MVDVENGIWWATQYALVPKDLYINYFYDHKFDIKPTILGSWDKFKVLGKIFSQFMAIVIKDIIENRTTFKLPFSGAWIEMAPITGDNFVKARQNGAFQDVDFLKSNFTGYQLRFRHTTRYRTKRKPIHVSKVYKDRITELTNQGVGW